MSNTRPASTRGRWLARSSGRLIAGVAALVAAACSSPTAPTQPPVAGPSISCPAPVTAESLDGGPVPANFPSPTTTGGAAPVNLTCTPASGSPFQLGTTEVACTARDALQRAASCSFTVTVDRPPQLAVTRILAFGDSITYGRNPECPPAPRGSVDTPYPTSLREMLAARYTAQSFFVTNSGVPGELAVEGDNRLPGVLSGTMPDVLLLLEGVNDIHGASPQSAGVGDVEDGIRSMIREARSRGVEVFVSTLLPERSDACRAFDFVDGVVDIAAANNEIRYLAATEGATLVDLYQVFAGREASLIGEDGLHPNDAGYLKIAETFFEALQARFEAP